MSLWQAVACWGLFYFSHSVAAAPSTGTSASTSTSSTVAVIQPSMPSLASPTTPGFVTPTLATVTASAPTASNTEKPPDWVARAVAIFGAILSVINFGWGIYKGKRDRKNSIEDDFWFRKIVTPATIEPLLVTFVGFFENLPVRTTLPDEQAEFARRTTTEFAKLYTSVQTLELFDEELPQLVTAKLQKCEDILAEYSGLLAQEDARKDQTPADLRVKVWAELREALKIVKDRHLKH